MSAQGPILIIEDDEDDQFMIRLALDQLNVSNDKRFFDNGQKALDYLLTTTERPFLIFCDINMPLMNGLELRETINENEYLRKKAVPFVFLTTSANQNAVRIAYDLTVQGYFKKASSFEGIKEQLQLTVAYWKNCLHPNNIAEV